MLLEMNKEEKKFDCIKFKYELQEKLENIRNTDFFYLYFLPVQLD
jgi:hypothetical protein